MFPTGGGARFFDGRHIDRGAAGHVTLRAPALGALTVLDVSDADGQLASFLLALDNKPLQVELLAGGTPLRFKWASAYTDGKTTKIQGVLERV